MEDIWGSIKIMLIVAGLATVISMLVAAIIKLLFAVIRRQRAPVEVKADTKTDQHTKPVGSEVGKAV